VRAGRRGSFVYTERGPSACLEKPRIPVTFDESLPADVQQPARDANLPIPLEKPCPHGGIFINGVPRCGLCFQQKGGGSPEESFNLFVMSLYGVCEKAAKKHWQWAGSIPLQDRWHHMICALLEPKNLRQLLTAKKPEALAYSIAQRRLIDLERSPVYWKEWNVSQLKFGNRYPDGDGNEATDEECLDTIVVEKKLSQEWAQECYERARILPGVNLLWTQENLQRLRITLDEAQRRLPTYPFSVSMAIKLHIGFFPETGKYTFEDVARWASEGGKIITPRQARYAIQNGLDDMKRHLLQTLVPDFKRVAK
jgi:hypothetical protein